MTGEMGKKLQKSYRKDRKPRKILSCPVCRSLFETPTISGYDKRFCSNKCWNEYCKRHPIKLSEEARTKMSEKAKLRRWSEEEKTRMSERLKKLWRDPKYYAKMVASHKTETYRRLMKHYNSRPEFRAKIRRERAKQILPIKDTSIELIVQRFLHMQGIKFISHYPIFLPDRRSHQADIYIPSLNLVIECDGVYWHSLSYRKNFDKYIDRKLPQMGYYVLRLPEAAIRSGDYKNILQSVKRDGANLKSMGIEGSKNG